MNTFFKLALAVILAAMVGTAFAADAKVDAATSKVITAAIHKLAPGAKVKSIEPSALPGMYVVVASGQVVYVSGDGKYMLQGSLYDLDTRSNLTETRMDNVRKAALAELDQSEMIEFAPKDPKYHVTVFTDIDCGYCRKLHSHMKEFNAEGIAVDYLFFPRTGIGSHSYDKAVSVWCADDSREAMTLAKTGKEPKPLKCDNPVAEDYNLGQRLGVTGTPTIIADDGSVLGGYLTPAQMLQSLKMVAARMKADADNKGS